MAHKKYCFCEPFQNGVDIRVKDHKVMRVMQRFIYMGKVLHLDKMANDLLAADNKVSFSFSGLGHFQTQRESSKVGEF